jgi:ABC-type Fe3+/spermidine/putrescine transport system ATPase subunit
VDTSIDERVASMTTSTGVVIHTEELTKVYPGNIRAVIDLNLDVNEGEIFGLLGPNGAGKTTTVGMLTTRVIPTEGRASLAGVDVVARPSEAKRLIGVVSQTNTLDRSLSVWENLYYHGRYFGMGAKANDVHGMADFITGYPGVDAERLGLLGICGGGGYSLKAAQSDKRFRAIATISMFNPGRVRRDGLQDSQLDTIQERLQRASAARAQEAAGGTVLYAGDADLTDEQIANQPFDLYRQGYESYWRTHAHPNSTFRYTMSSLLDLMTFDVTDHIGLIDKPLLMIAGSKADTRYMTEEAFSKTTGTEDRNLFIIEGATHIETYWVDEYVDAALGKMTSFFERVIV